jgi:hypothetical protein
MPTAALAGPSPSPSPSRQPKSGAASLEDTTEQGTSPADQADPLVAALMASLGPLAGASQAERVEYLDRQLRHVREAHSADHTGFGRIRAFFVTHLAMITSVVVHGSVLLIGLVTVSAVRPILSVAREQIIVPEAQLVDNAVTGGLPNPGLGADPNLLSAQDVDPNVAAVDGWASQRGQSLTSTLVAGGSSDAADSVIGLGTRAGISGTGAAGAGGSGAEGGAMAPFGVPGGGQGLGPKSPFMGISGNARKVVYVCDASGSMMSVFWRVKEELRKAVDVLRPIQAFNVIFLSYEDVTALDKNSLVMANPENKRKAMQLVENTSAAGNTDAALPAIRKAFELRPDLIYLLTDGFQSLYGSEMSEAVIKELRKLNADKKVRVNIILIKSANEDTEFEKAMRTVASENGGVCKIIDRQNL